VKTWLRTASVTTIFVDRDGRAPYDAVTRADSNGDQTSFAYPVSTPVTVGEIAIPRRYTATINCGSGARPYNGGPFAVTSPAEAGATLVCTIVNRAPNPTPKPKPKPKRVAKPKPVLVVAKTATKKVVRVGQSVAFVITVRNRGLGTATNAIVCDRAPDGLVFTRARGAHFVNGDACWRIASLRPKRTTSFVSRLKPVRVERRTVLVNIAMVTSASSCSPRATLAASRTGAVCRARAVVAVLPARAKRGGGVTG
jgi:uncharacterized repeat protein (TIGR01451 family)